MNGQKLTTKKAVIYCRVSTKEQVEEGNSLVSQEKFCREYAFKNSYDVAQIFIEQGESAKSRNRTELTRLFDYCKDKRNGVNVVIAYKIDRISRNMDDYSFIRLTLKRYGVEIKSTSENFENTPAGRFMENIIANVAQFDNDVRTERSIGGMKEAMREGRYVWRAPLGYINSKIGGKSNIVQDNMAALLKKAFELIAENNMYIDDVRTKITKAGLLGKKGKPCNRGYFYTLLKNPIYSGWIIKFGEKHLGEFEPIVSQELFDQVSRVLKYRSRYQRQYQKENPDFPLRRFIKSPTNESLTGGWSKGKKKYYPYYQFKSPNYSIRKEDLENRFMDLLDSLSLKQEYNKDFFEKIKIHLIDATRDEKQVILNAKRNISELKEKQDILIDKNIKGIITDNILSKQIDSIEHEIMKTEATLLRIPTQFYNLSKLFEMARMYLENPSKIWAKANLKQKIKLQVFNFPKGLVFDGQNFRTPEIVPILKEESSFFRKLSVKVPLGNQSSNTLNITKSFDIKEYWKQNNKQYIELGEIVEEVEDPKVVPHQGDLDIFQLLSQPGNRRTFLH